MEKNLLPVDGEVHYFSDLFSREESASFLSTLLREIEWKQEPIVMFGKKMMQPRLTAWYGDAGKTYRYSGITMQPKPWTPSLLEIKHRIESKAGVTFNSALANQYRDENDSMGWHRDDEKELGKNPVIGSVNFGASREFRLRHREKKDLSVALTLESGSFLLMGGETQHHWLHSVPKCRTSRAARINLTFRIIH
jgi:alkylated DNA repair dioxygenase AlkB